MVDFDGVHARSGVQRSARGFQWNTKEASHENARMVSKSSVLVGSTCLGRPTGGVDKARGVTGTGADSGR